MTVTDEQQGSGKKDAITAAKGAKSNGTAPTVTARRPISKDEYARTTKAEPDSTAVIPAVRDDQPPPRTSVDDDTQLHTAVGADGLPKTAATTAPTKAAPTKAAPKVAKPAAAAPAVAPAPPAAPAPAKPEQKTPEPKKPEPAPAAKTDTGKQASAEQTKTAPAAAPATTRSAKLKVKHVEPWSVTKMAFVVSVALMIVSVVAVSVFWTVLQITGVWGALNDSVSNVLADDSAGFDVTDYLGFGRVVGLTLLVSSLNVIFMTALATIAAHLYNLAAGLLGGIELTFGERQ